MIEDYLRELRARLRTRPHETERIIAEAEDHLAQTVAAGLAAGLSEIEAQEAAISAFGSVPAVVRAHMTHRVRLRVLAADLPMVVWKLAWLWLLVSGVVRLPMAVMPGMLTYVLTGGQVRVLRPQPVSPALAFQAGWMLALGLGLAVGYRLVRARRPNPFGGFFPLAAAVFFVVAIPVSLAAGAVNGLVGPQGQASAFVAVALAVAYCARMAGTLIWQRVLVWQRRTS